MAFVLGHEIQGREKEESGAAERPHRFCEQVAKDLSLQGPDKKTLREECLADYQGGLYAQAADFDVLALMPEVVDRIISDFPARNPGEATLTKGERRADRPKRISGSCNQRCLFSWWRGRCSWQGTTELRLPCLIAL